MKSNATSQKKVLPVTYPPITTYPYATNILSILSNHNEAIPWLINNNILIWIDSKGYEKFYWCDFKYYVGDELCPLLKIKIENRDVIATEFKSIIDFLIDCIDKGWYIYISINMYYIQQYTANEPPRRPHEMFVYGYDKFNRTLYVSDFFKGKYSNIELSFSQFEIAYENFTELNIVDALGGPNLMMYSPTAYNIDIKSIKNNIQDFIMSTSNSLYSNWEMFFNPGITYGMNCFNVLRDYLVFKLDARGTYIDIRPFHVLCEYNKLMLLRIDYLKNNNYIDRDERTSELFIKNGILIKSLRNKLIKCNLTRNEAILKGAIQSIPDMAHNEKIALESMLNLL